MLKHFWIVSYDDSESMGYDSIIYNASDIAKEIFYYIEIFNKSEDKSVTIKVVEYKLTEKYDFQNEEEFFNSYEWNDDSFDEEVIVRYDVVNLKK
jgi:hypothetical protein